jgi:hypothetical protein
MFSASIKNFILVVLIILIVHFIIKNHIIEHYESNTNIKTILDMKNVRLASFDPVIVPPKEKGKETFIDTPIYDKEAIDNEKKKQLEQLYDFVYDKENSNTASNNFDPSQVTDIQEFNSEKVLDKDELFDGISGYNSVNEFSSY